MMKRSFLLLGTAALCLQLAVTPRAGRDEP